MFPTTNGSSDANTITYSSDQSMLLDKFLLSSDIVGPNSKTLPPSFLFPFSPSFVNDVEFVSHHHHQYDHLDLLTQSTQTHYPRPLTTINDTSSDTIAYDSAEITTNDPNKTTSTIDIVLPNSGKNHHQHNSTNYIRKTRDLMTTTKNQQSPRTRSAKKDRHSKIVTAQGPRDRRMRLSLDIARRFFTLQDMLHFDKASKTVEWLLTKSRSAIKELSRGFSEAKNSFSDGGKSTGGSSTSECEVISGVVDTMMGNEYEEDHDHRRRQQQQQQVTIKCKEKRTRQTRKATFHPGLARESRAKARARARERTMERLWTRSQQSRPPPEGNLDNVCTNNNQLRSCSSGDNPFEAVEESGTHSFDMKSNSSLEVVGQEVEKASSHHPSWCGGRGVAPEP